jgi:hypothetical protein
MNSNTKYCIIACDWNPALLLSCPQFFGEIGYAQLPKPNNGLANLSKVEHKDISVILDMHP